MRAGKIDRSLLRGESFELFSAAIRSPATRDPYERKLLGFLKRVNLTPEQFSQFAKESPSAAEKKILSLLSQDRLRIERGEITGGTVNNWLKAVRLFLEINDVILNWKKIKRMLPTIRRYALDRVPTLEELREILDAADVRGKALTLVLVSSGIREGAVPSLRVSNYSKIRAPLSDAGACKQLKYDQIPMLILPRNIIGSDMLTDTGVELTSNYRTMTAVLEKQS